MYEYGCGRYREESKLRPRQRKRTPSRSIYSEWVLLEWKIFFDFGVIRWWRLESKEHHELKITLLELLRIWIWPEANYDVFSHLKRSLLPSPLFSFCQPTERYAASDDADADDSVAPCLRLNIQINNIRLLISSPSSCISLRISI